MCMIYNDKRIVENIKEFIENKISEKKIVNRILQDDVFELLNRECILLYYPLDDNNKGMHMEKVIGSQTYQFVYINTSKKVEEQTWTAAHELGHVWKVDKAIYSKMDSCTYGVEDIVNRFAAELLMPDKEFYMAYIYAKDKINKESRLSLSDFIRLVAYLMNTFCVPYKAVIKRMVELDLTAQENEEKYINSFTENYDYFEKVIKEKYYTKLDCMKETCSMEEIASDIDLLETTGIVKQTVIDRYRKEFNIEEDAKSAETFELGGQDGN